MGSIAQTAVAAPAPDPKDPMLVAEIKAALSNLSDELSEHDLDRQNLVITSRAVSERVAYVEALIRRLTPELVSNEEKLFHLLPLLNLHPIVENLLRSVLVPTDRGFWTVALDLTPPEANNRFVCQPCQAGKHAQCKRGICCCACGPVFSA